ncbi:nuclear transport factor 2 family protein [Rhodoblastus acidophilus]|uniref:Nuclear transport factor 2 family protein n=1 Tax=Candidatus Rhodoblastus alkanivorans TaxID=2954117 RepID=A0ABS9ZAN8_9HYPH|nr:nuclear transport factor 2 family protein [Candidatus Rhodoblastus alkanivorans]MCI4677743.1 nuclear transport factor 2 family protein [Candidatus Rhodoblastus alkanivorans]MCI4684759.1 nuclear transport factor 2 family protein [Candidatus Rhodoblastus alkanivorans]
MSGMSGGESESLASQFSRMRFEQIVSTLLDRRSDPAKLEALFAPEADWMMNGDRSRWPYAGLSCRRESILAYLKAFSVEFQQKKIRFHDVLINGEQACARYEMRLRHRGTGREDLLQCLSFIRVEGDAVVEVHEFIDSALLFRLRESVED